MSRYTAEIVARCALGIDGRNFKENVPEMHEMGKIFFEPDLARNLKLMALFFLPRVGRLLRLR